MRAIGVDVGGTYVRAALIEYSNNSDPVVQHVIRYPHQQLHPEAMAHTIAQLCAELDATSMLPVGVAVAAQISMPEGYIHVAPNLRWSDVSFRLLLQQQLQQPFRLLNDVNACAVAESYCCAQHHSQNVVCVLLGTGLGMGAVVHGQLLEGAHGLATEIGHIKIASSHTGRLCGCGERGCIEAYISGRYLGELYDEMIKDDQIYRAQLERELGGAVKDIATAWHIEQYHQTGVQYAKVLWQDIAQRLSAVLAQVVVLFDPERLLLGGGVLGCAPTLLASTISRLKDLLPQAYRRALQIEMCYFGEHAGLIGAGYAAACLKA